MSDAPKKKYEPPPKEVNEGQRDSWMPFRTPKEDPGNKDGRRL